MRIHLHKLCRLVCFVDIKAFLRLKFSASQAFEQGEGHWAEPFPMPRNPAATRDARKKRPSAGKYQMSILGFEIGLEKIDLVIKVASP